MLLEIAYFIKILDRKCDNTLLMTGNVDEGKC